MKTVFALAVMLVMADGLEVDLPDQLKRVNLARAELNVHFRAEDNEAGFALLKSLAEAEPWHTSIQMSGYSIARFMNKQSDVSHFETRLANLGVSASGEGALMQPYGQTTIIAHLANAKLCESVVELSAGDILVGCVVDRRIYRINVAGEQSELVSTGDLAGRSVLGMSLVPDESTVWVALATVDQTPVHDSDTNVPDGWAAIDTRSGKILEFIAAPQGVQPGDVRVLGDGSVLASNSRAGELYSLKADQAELMFRIKGRSSFQGIAESPDGKVYISDYSNGFWEWDRKGNGDVRLLLSDVLLSGHDGLSWYNGGLVAIRNGFHPHQVVWYGVGDQKITGKDILASAVDGFGEPTTGQVRGTTFRFVANSQWPAFTDGGKVKAGQRLEPTRIMKIDLPEAR